MDKPEYNFGDLVHVDGYWPRIFIVDGYREERFYYPNEQWTDLVYELHDAHTAEWVEADEDDLFLVETADKADEYLAEKPVIIFGMEAVTMQKPPANVKNEIKHKEMTEKINNLLEIRHWNRIMHVKTGDDSFDDRAFAIDCELKKLTDD
jgi:hypothetical protein